MGGVVVAWKEREGENMHTTVVLDIVKRLQFGVSEFVSSI